MLNTDKIRADFNILDKKEGERPIYFDSACMSLKPKQVIEAMNDYYIYFSLIYIKNQK